MSPPPLCPSPAAGGFVAFDARVTAGMSEPGIVVVRAPDRVHAAIVAHAARRLRASGHLGVAVIGTPQLGTPTFREVATQLGIGALPSDPAACAEAVAREALARRAVLVVPLPAEGSWDRAVASALTRRSDALLVVFLTADDAPSLHDEGDRVAHFELDAALTADVKRRWMNAVAEDEHVGVHGDDLSAMEDWWSSARRATPETTPSLDGVDEIGRHVLSCLALAGRTLSLASLASLGEGAMGASTILVSTGLAIGTHGFVAASPRLDRRTLEALASDEARVATARILVDGARASSDPWAEARAAELLLAAGAFEAADDAMSRASRSVDDGQAAHEIGSRWFDAVAPFSGEAGLSLRRSAARRALDMGEAGEAQRWCESAMSITPEDPEVLLLAGRVHVQLGDLVAARVCLQKAQRSTTTDEQYARVVAELAEVSYHAADLEQAKAYANTAIALATTGSTRLAARNTLGKILLGAGAWDACDEHFTEDATTARSCGDRTAELRARVNRGIALLSKGLLEDARAVLEGVLDDAARFGEDRARAYALHNLAVIAEQQHDYGRALEHWEASARFPVTLCGRISSARMLANLASLRLRLGLVAHADHTIAFGRRVLGARSSTGAGAHFAIVAARVALARGNSALARREVDRAVVDAERAGYTGYWLPEAYVVSARVALEDGDLTRAADAIAAAAARATSGRSRAELALLEAIHLRAKGASALEAACEALAAAQVVREEDLLLEVHALLGAILRDAGDEEAARAHCARGIGVRDQIAASLTPETRSAFLAKTEVCALARLQASLGHDEPCVTDEAPRYGERGRRSVAAATRELVGDDPQMRALMSAVRKVARSETTVLVRGESGTGKELVAEAIHRASDRAAGPLVSVNCAALVETLLLSELFGHEKGAFTGAGARRRGRFELADGGTLFLDEIGDISARTQVALLRVLQEKTFERVGGGQPIRANVRVVCATHRNLKAMVERGEFREDLFYRLSGITLEVPALRARPGDVPKIAEHLLGRIANERGEPVKRVAPDALELLRRHRWPGNVRELENVLRVASLFAEGDVITASDLVDNVDDLRALAQTASRSGASSAPPESARTTSPPEASGDGDEEDDAPPETESRAAEVAYAQVRRGKTSLFSLKKQIERDCIARALVETNGNITRAATLLGVKRPRLSQLVKQYGLSMNAEVNE